MRYVIYYRVSTKRQGESGLGLDAQKRDIDLYFNNYVNSSYSVIGEFTDIGSGADDDRTELHKAIALAKKEKATLLVAKLDRLSRRVSFMAKLIEDKRLMLKVACMPNADKFQLHIYIALAEQERDFISKRTKDALRQAKARGVKLGGLRDKTNERNKALVANAQARADKLLPTILPMRQQGYTLKQIADELISLSVPTAQGGVWTAKAVSRLLARQ